MHLAEKRFPLYKYELFSNIYRLVQSESKWQLIEWKYNFTVTKHKHTHSGEPLFYKLNPF